MTYARFYRKMTRGEKSPTLLRRGENFGRTGGVFGTVFAGEILPPRLQGTKKGKRLKPPMHADEHRYFLGFCLEG